MLNPKFYLFALCLISGTYLNADINTNEIVKKTDPVLSQLIEGVNIPIPDDELTSQWSLENKAMAQNGSWIYEWVPKGETVLKWSQLIQLQYFPESEFDGDLTASEFAGIFIMSLKEQFPRVKIDEISKSKDNVLIEWSLPSPQGTEQADAQDEIARFITTKTGVFRIAYTKKVTDMGSDMRAIWRKRLADSKITPITKKAQEVAK